MSFLEVDSADQGAQLFYQAMNYRDVETLRGYYGGRSDLCRLQRVMPAGLQQPQKLRKEPWGHNQVIPVFLGSSRLALRNKYQVGHEETPGSRRENLENRQL